MTTSEKITAALLGRMSSAFSKSPSSNNYAIMAAIAAELHEISDVLDALTETQHIDTASGASLDSIVDLLGIERTSETDTALRTAYYIEQNRRRSCGTMPNIKAIVARITGYPKEAVQVLEPAAGKFSLVCGKIVSDSDVIYTDGWGLDEWGYAPWGSAYLPVISTRAGPTLPINLTSLATVMNKVKAGGVGYLTDDIVFLTPAKIQLSATISTAITCMEWWLSVLSDLPLGWGYEEWGTSPWGGTTSTVFLSYSGSNTLTDA